MAPQPASARNAEAWAAPPALPDGHYVSGLVYTDEAIYADEMRQIHGKVWHLACHESELAKAHDFRTMQHAGVPLVVIRRKDGRARASSTPAPTATPRSCRSLAATPRA